MQKELYLFHIEEEEEGGILNPTLDFRMKYDVSAIDVRPIEMKMENEFENKCYATVKCKHCLSDVDLKFNQVTLAVIPRILVYELFYSKHNMTSEFIREYISFARISSMSAIFMIFFIGILPAGILFMVLSNVISNFFQNMTVSTTTSILLLTYLLLVIFFTLRAKSKSEARLLDEVGEKDVVIVVNSKEMFDYLFSFESVRKVTLIKEVAVLDSVHRLTRPIDRIDRIPPNIYIFNCEPEYSSFYKNNIKWEYS